MAPGAFRRQRCGAGSASCRDTSMHCLMCCSHTYLRAENVSAAEVEEVLVRMPGVVEAVVVAAPDARLGERVCAFLRPDVGAPLPSLDEVRAAMADAGLARQKWPEEVHPGDDLPRTPSGKVQKAILRQRLRATAEP